MAFAASEHLEPRILLAADIAYPDDPLDSLFTDMTLVAEVSQPNPILTLYQTGTDNQLASVTLDDPADVEVNIARAILPEGFGDTLRIDIGSFELLNDFVSNNGGQLAINFNGGTQVPIVAEDQVRIEGGVETVSLDYGLVVDTESDVTVAGVQALFDGVFQVDTRESILVVQSTVDAANIHLNAVDNSVGEGDALEPTEVVALPSVGITVDQSRLIADDIALSADASVETNIELADLLDGGISIGAVLSTASADIAVENGSRLLADNSLSLQATTDVNTSLIRAPEDDGDDMDDDQTQDASIATSVLNSSASVTVGGESQLAGGSVDILADNQVIASTMADGSVGSGDAGGIVATTFVQGDTSVLIHEQASISSAGDLNIQSTSDRTVSTSAIATSEGAADDGNDGTSTEGQNVLADNDASTSDGDVTLAATVAVSSLGGDTRALVDGATLSSSAGHVSVVSSAVHDVTTSSDASTTSGAEDTGIGVGVAIGRVNVQSDANVSGESTLSGHTVTIEGTIENGVAHSAATSGPSGDSEADIGVAGALAIQTSVTEATASIADSANVQAAGAAIVLNAESATSGTTEASPSETPSGESLGVGASVAIQVADHTTHAGIGNDAILEGASDLTIASDATQNVTTHADGAAAGGTAIAAVVSLAIANEDTTANVGEGSQLDIGGELTISATHGGTTDTQARGDAEGQENAAIGAAIALNFVDQRTEATLARNVNSPGHVALAATELSTNDVLASASARGAEGESGGGPDVDTQTAAQRGAGDQAAASGGARNSSGTESTSSASTADGTVSVAAAVGVNLVESVTRTQISETSTIDAGGMVSLQSESDVDVTTMADATAVGGESAAIGAAVGINRANVANQAVVQDGAAITANELTVSATMNDSNGDGTHTFNAATLAGAGDTEIGVAGSVAINLVDTDTQARIGGDSLVHLNGGALQLESESTTDSSSTAAPTEDGGEGSEVGVGASLALNRVSNHVEAEIADEAMIAGQAGSVLVQADGSHVTTTDAQNGASAGDVAVGAAVAIAIVDNDTHVRAGTGPALDVSTTAAFVVNHESQVTGIVGAEAAGDSVGCRGIRGDSRYR